MRRVRFLAVTALVLAACSPSPDAGESTTTTAETVTTSSVVASTTSTPSTTTPAVEVNYSVCDYDAPWPSAPDDWYRDTPVYVGNNSPTDEVRRFVSSIPGFVDVWIDRDHLGWVSAGFVGADVEAIQVKLEEEFPEGGVVAVELAYTASELEEMAAEIHSQLPEGMYALNTHEIWGRIEVFVGLLTPENVALVEEIGGDYPYCIEGLDPVQFDQSPQADRGDGWVFLGVSDTYIGDVPAAYTDQTAFESAWDDLEVGEPAPSVDFNESLAVFFQIGYSGSCPDTRFRGVILEGDRLMPDVAHVTIAQMCTSDYNSRVYAVGLDRDSLPAPPFYLVEWPHSSAGLMIDVDLRDPSAVLDGSNSRIVPLDRPRTATDMPLYMETGGFPWEFIVPDDCDLTYLGEVNGIGWHLAEDSAIPASWANLAVDDVIDLQIQLFEGPDPIAVVSGGGDEATYVPGDTLTPACQP